MSEIKGLVFSCPNPNCSSEKKITDIIKGLLGENEILRSEIAGLRKTLHRQRSVMGAMRAEHDLGMFYVTLINATYIPVIGRSISRFLDKYLERWEKRKQEKKSENQNNL